MRKYLYFLLLSLSLPALQPPDLMAQHMEILGPVGSTRFGNGVYVLTNGNYVVTDLGYDFAGATNAGAVYLINGKTHKCISTLVGSHHWDQVGTSIVPLPNGNFVVGSPYWRNVFGNEIGAVTWVNGTTGLNAIVSASNSLIGSSVSDHVGYKIEALANGNYVVLSPEWNNGSVRLAGAATWGNGSGGTTGLVSSSNSMVGSSSSDFVGSFFYALKSGNYVVGSQQWDNGNAVDAGALTWCNGTTGRSGVTGSSNSLVGSGNGDQVGNNGIAELSNGNYVVHSSHCSNGNKQNAGAVTWCSGTAGITGIVDAGNSLIGSETNDYVGSNPALTLINGNYVILSPSWDNGAIVDAGAATWCDGTSGGSGMINIGNSLVGDLTYKNVGNEKGSIALTNGNYVVGAKLAAAYTIYSSTWCNGSSGRTGVIDSSNSLLGIEPDWLDNKQCVALTNGNYVVLSPFSSSPTAWHCGAATFCDGTKGRTGTIDTSNSLVGEKRIDNIGINCIPLQNGNYVVLSPRWQNGTRIQSGAATLCNGTTGRTGVVDTNNSIVGSGDYDNVGENCLALTNGNYVVLSPKWQNSAGAATWCSGTTVTKGIVGAGNSLVGANNYQHKVGTKAVALTNGNCVVSTPTWYNSSPALVGSSSWMSGSAPTAGIVDTSNSLIGTTAIDTGGLAVISLANGSYLEIKKDNGPTTFNVGIGTGGTAGLRENCNAAIGISWWLPVWAYNPVYGYMIFGFDRENKIVITTASPQHISQRNGVASHRFTDTLAAAFLDADDKLMCLVRPASPFPAAGNVTAKLELEPIQPYYNGHAYVARHFDLSSSDLVATSNLTVTLYFTQPEFDSYNVANGSDADLPASPNDATGIANLRVSQQRGASPTGMPGTYSGWSGSGAANVLLDPVDEDIVWNDCDSRWEVTLDIAGFGGLFIHGDQGGSPLSTPNSVLGKSGLSISPVPATEVIQIRCEDDNLIHQAATITDIYGRVLEQFPLEKSQKINIGNLPVGTYYLHAGGREVRKFLKL